MRGKHPIDERFRQALYDREADPPEAVRTALGTHLGWTSAPRTNGAWWPMVLVVVGFVGTGAALWAWQDGGGPATINSEHRVAEQRVGVGGVPTNGAAPVTSSTSGEPATQVGPGEGSTTNTNGTTTWQPDTIVKIAPEGSSYATNNAFTGTSTKRVARASETSRRSTTAGGAVRGSQNTRSNVGGDGASGSIAATSITAIGPENRGGAAEAKPLADPQGSMPNNPEAPAVVRNADQLSLGQNFRTFMMDPLRIVPDAPVPSGTPVRRALPPNYVLPAGTWWVGPYVGIGTVQGKWKGADTDALEEAEQWRSTAQGGLLIGRAWRSGWGVSMGLGVARVRSTFEHSDATSGSSVLEVDTTWGTTMHTNGDILYNWQIDSLVEETPGGLVRRDARNLYTAIQVPMLLHWHADARRLRYGAFGGITAWIPTQRTGLTLATSPQDGPTTTIPLQDAKVDDRFSAQIHGMAGVSIGYTITEYLSAFAEPMISAPLFSFEGSNMPWLTRPLLQFRLQYELRSKVR